MIASMSTYKEREREGECERGTPHKAATLELVTLQEWPLFGVHQKKVFFILQHPLDTLEPGS